MAPQTYIPSQTYASSDKAYHPCDPLTPQEIRAVSAAFKTELLRKGIRSIKSTYVDLIEREP